MSSEPPSPGQKGEREGGLGSPLAPDTHCPALQPPAGHSVPRGLEHHSRWLGEDEVRARDSSLASRSAVLQHSDPLLGLSFLVCKLVDLENIPGKFSLY